MHMWFWWGWNLGDFLFSGLVITTRWAFVITFIVLFISAVLFEASKVYLARVQRAAQKKLYPHRSDERRNLLCGERGSVMEASTSRNAATLQGGRWEAIKIRMLVNCHQTAMFLVHNVAGYLLMLAVMLYNVYLLLAVVLGMMLGYFLFGTKLTRLQMQCFSTKRVVICTPECDDTAEGTTPPLLDGSMSSESDFFICQTRTCITPSHYFPASSVQYGGPSTSTCQYGAKKCPSKVARARQLQSTIRQDAAKEDSPVEDVQLLRTQRQGCCKKEQGNTDKCCSKPAPVETVVVIESQGCCKKKEPEEPPPSPVREDSPQITCCHNAKSVTSESQEHIVN